MSDKVVAVVQARMTSSRLPGKILKAIAGAPLIQRMLERVGRIQGVDEIVVALAEGAPHDPVCAVLDGLGIATVRGSEDDVLARNRGGGACGKRGYGNADNVGLSACRS